MAAFTDLLEFVRQTTGVRRTDTFRTDARSDVEIGASPQLERERAFLDRARSLRDQLNQIEDARTELERVYNSSKSATTASAVQRYREASQAIVNDVNKRALAVKQQVESIEAETNELLKSGELQQNSAYERTRTSMVASLRKKLADSTAAFNKLRERMHSEYKQTVANRMYAVRNAAPSDAEVEQVIESGDAESIFQQEMQSGQRQRVMDTVMEIHERHDAFLALNASLLELHQLYVDMSVLVEAQGQIVDNVDAVLQRALSHVQSGNVGVQEAKVEQGKARHKQMWIWIIIAIVIVVLLIILIPSIACSVGGC